MLLTREQRLRLVPGVLLNRKLLELFFKCFVRNSQDEILLKRLIVRVYPSRRWFAVVVDRKAVGDYIIQRLATFISETGLINFAYRSDREPALLTLFDEACRLCCRQGRRLLRGEHPDDVTEDLSEHGDVFDMDTSGHDTAIGSSKTAVDHPEDSATLPDAGDASKEEQMKEAMRFLKSGDPMPVAPNIAVREHSHPVESQANGRAERSIRTFVELFATLKGSLEYRLQLQQPLPCHLPIVR